MNVKDRLCNKIDNIKGRSIGYNEKSIGGDVVGVASYKSRIMD